MANEVLTKKFKYYTKGAGHKYRRPEVEITLKKKDHVINYETMEEENDVWVFTASGHYNGCWGQCLDEIEKAIPYIKNYEKSKGWDSENNRGCDSAYNLQRIIDIWRTYHLNDMKAGTKKQMDCLKDFVFDRELERKDWHKHSYYDQECDFLDERGLWYDRDADYRFGTKWLYMPIPDEIVEELMVLLNSTTFGY